MSGAFLLEERRIRAEAPRRRVQGRDYGGGQLTRLDSDWTAYPRPIDEILYQQMRLLRARSREQCRSNPYAKKFKRLVGANIIGPPGITLISLAKTQAGTPDKATRRAIEDAWVAYGKAKACDIERRLTLRQQWRLAIETVAQDGEVFLRRVYEDRPDNPWGVTYQMLDPELCDIFYREELPNGNYIRLGIEFDPWRRRVAYHFWKNQRSDPLVPYFGMQRIRIPAEEIIHLFLAEDVGQSRGVPWTATALYRLHMHGEYEKAALIASRIGALNGGFFEKEYGDDSFVGEKEGSDEAIVEELNPETPFRELPAGMKFNQYRSDYPRGEFAPFNAAMLQGISAGFLTSYHSISGDLTRTNYASIKFALENERDAWKEGQDWCISDLPEPQFDDWMKMQLLRGTIRVNGIPLRPDYFPAYRSCRWQPRVWSPVDPSIEVKADADAVNARQKSLSSVIRAHGADPEDTFDEIQSDEASLAKRGISPPVLQSGQIAATPDPGAGTAGGDAGAGDGEGDGGEDPQAQTGNEGD